MITLLGPDFVLEEVSRQDITIASLAWGFTIGFGWLTTWTAMKQTKQVWKRHGWRVLRNAYVWMIWLEILVCLIFGIICYLYLLHVIPPSFAFYFTILTTWALQVQFLLQIIVNRCSVLSTNKQRAYRIKVGVAILITAVNISVYNIWIPARLQISERYIWINEWWDRCEKGIYLLVDACLNAYFIRIVHVNLVKHGLTKYRTLERFNLFIVGFSLSMDVLIIGMMSLSNTFVYMQFHPFAYIVKLNIEMSMADLIGKIARNRQCGVISDGGLSPAAQSRPRRNNGSSASRTQDDDDLEAGRRPRLLSQRRALESGMVWSDGPWQHGQVDDDIESAPGRPPSLYASHHCRSSDLEEPGQVYCRGMGGSRQGATSGGADYTDSGSVHGSSTTGSFGDEPLTNDGHETSNESHCKDGCVVAEKEA